MKETQQQHQPSQPGKRPWPSQRKTSSSIHQILGISSHNRLLVSTKTQQSRRRWISGRILPMLVLLILQLLSLAVPLSAAAAAQQAEQPYYYTPDASGSKLNLMDADTEIDNIRTIFLGDLTRVTLENLRWQLVEEDDGEVEEDDDYIFNNNIQKQQQRSNKNSTTLVWETAVNDVLVDSGRIDLAGIPSRELPTSIEAGSIVIDEKQTARISVTVFLLGHNGPATGTTTCSQNYQAFAKGVSLLPLVAILLLAVTTHMVELSLFLGIWLGAWILEGSLARGFTTTLTEFLVGALADEGHVYVILFTVFLSGTVGMMQKSGGTLGFTNAVSKIARTPRGGQFACMLVGLVVFFDDYANVLLTGETLRPLLDVLCVSREKLAFIVDATAAPVASIAPISTWVGFEAGLIQEALDVLQKRSDDDELTIPGTGFGVFLESIRYSYYSLFMIGLVLMLIGTQRDYGPMLVAERRVRVYDRVDGGPGAAHSGVRSDLGTNEPRPDQPLHMHNMLAPIVVLVILFFVVLIETGSAAESGSGQEQQDQPQDPLILQLVENARVEETSIMGQLYKKIEAGDSYLALLYGTMGMTFVSIILYHLQITVPGTEKLTLPTPYIVKEMLPWRKAEILERGDEPPRFLMTIHESAQAFLYGMARIFLAIVILTLAWASGSVMTTVGVDRMFSSWITGGGIPYETLPTVTFLIAALMGTATGTSWGTMAILYPLILVPTYEASGGDPEIFYATVSAVLGGAVAGDHVSPISDTTVLTALACDVTLMGHVTTQAPYVVWVVVFSVLLGYLPIGYAAYPNMVGLMLGWIFCGAFVMLVCAPVLDKDGSWDRLTQLLCGRSNELRELAEDCAKKYRGESLENEVELELEVSLNLRHDDDDDSENVAADDDDSNELSYDDVGKKDDGSESSSQEGETEKSIDTATEKAKPLLDSTTAPTMQSDSEKRLSSNHSEEYSA